MVTVKRLLQGSNEREGNPTKTTIIENDQIEYNQEIFGDKTGQAQ